jgi:hypothetical protein
MPLSPVQLSQKTHALTADDITKGYVIVPIVWPEPFTDTDYSVVLGIHDLDDPPNLSFTTGDVHDLTPEGCNALAYVSAAVPLIQGEQDLVGVNYTTPISVTVPITTLYQVTFYYGPSGVSGAGTWSPTVQWQDPSGNNQTLAYPFLGPATAGDVTNLQSYSIPFFVKANTPIVVSGTYSGASFPLNLSVRVVRMPNNSTIAQPGDVFMLHALGIHN